MLIPTLYYLQFEFVFFALLIPGREAFSQKNRIWIIYLYNIRLRLMTHFVGLNSSDLTDLSLNHPTHKEFVGLFNASRRRLRYIEANVGI